MNAAEVEISQTCGWRHGGKPWELKSAQGPVDTSGMMLIRSLIEGRIMGVKDEGSGRQE